MNLFLSNYHHLCVKNVPSVDARRILAVGLQSINGKYPELLATDPVIEMVHLMAVKVSNKLKRLGDLEKKYIETMEYLQSVKFFPGKKNSSS